MDLRPDKEVTSFKRETVKGASWSTLESMAGQGLSFLIFLILARLLTPRDFGIIAVANIYVLISQYLIFQGLGQAILQFPDLDGEYLDTIFWINLAIGSAFVLLTLAGASAIEAWTRTPGLGPVLRGLSPVLLIAAITDVPNNLLARQMRFRSLAWRTLVSYLAGAVAAIIFALHGAGAWSLVAQQLAVWLANLVALWLATPWRPAFRFCSVRMVRLLRFGVHLLWSDLAGLLSRRSDQLFVARSFGPVVGGFYSVGARVSMLVSEVLIRSLGRVTTTVLSRLQTEGERFNKAVYQVVEMQSALILPVSVGLALVAPDVVALFLGGKWAQSVRVVQILLLACPLEALSTVHQSTLIALGRPQWCSRITTAHALANLAIFSVAIHWGPLAVAAAYTIRALLLYPVEVAVLRRVAAFSPARFLRLLFPQAVAVALMAAAVQLSRHWLESTPHIFLLSASVVAGAVTYVAAVGVLNGRVASELWSYRALSFWRAGIPATQE